MAMLRIHGRARGARRFYCFDAENGCLVVNPIFGSLFSPENRGRLQEMLDRLNADNPGHEFEIRTVKA